MSLDFIRGDESSFGRREPGIRLIPSLENCPSLVEFIKKPVGRLCAVGLFLALLYTFDFASFVLRFQWSLALAIFILGYLNAPLRARLWAAVLLFYFFDAADGLGPMSSHLPQIASVVDAAARVRTSFLGDPLLEKGLLLLPLLFLLWIVLQALKVSQSRFPVLWVLAFWSLLMAAGIAVPENSYFYSPVWLVISRFSICAFPLAFYAVSGFDSTRGGLWSAILFSLQNNLYSSRMVFLRSPTLLEGTTEESARAVCRIKALKLLLWTRVLRFFHVVIIFHVFDPSGDASGGFSWLPKLHWPSYTLIGIQQYNALGLPWWQVLATVLLSNVHFLLSLCISSGVAIATFRLSGIYLPRAVCRPHLARSFNEYFRRSLYYYSEAILHLFFYPLYRRLNTFSISRKLRANSALFIALLAGGWAYHLVLVWQTFLFFSWRSALANTLSWLPYFTMIAFACCISGTGWLGEKLKYFPWPAHFALNFMAQSIMLVSFQYYMGETWDNRLSLIRAMLP